jgi:hypothetical protein
MGMTINNMVMSCLSAAMKEYFESIDKIKMENKFSVVPIDLPLAKDLTEASKLVTKATAKLRNAFREVYATYASSYYAGMFSPYFLSNWFLLKSSLPFTLAFSNAPGLLKPITIGGKNTIKQQAYFVASGKIGLSMCLVSYIDYFTISCVADTAVMTNPEAIVSRLEKNIRKLISDYKDAQINESNS